MTTFTTPHSLPILETSDKIAASGDGLREDLNAISNAANTALESVAATAAAYTDVRDEAYRVVDRALWRAEDDEHEAAAKAYTDTKDTSNRAAWAAADTAKLATAKAYTDTRETDIRADFATSHVALDLDGTPFFQVGSMTVRVLQDTDGTPYYEAA